MEIWDGSSKSGKLHIPEDLLFFLNPHPLPNKFWDLLITQWPKGKASKAAIEEFRTTLCALVNQWIDSGKNRDGELPRERVVPIETLKEFMQRHPPQLERVTLHGPLGLFVSPRLFRMTDQLQAARNAATFSFMKLMDSPTRARLSRCDLCGTYFVRTRTPKKNMPIYHGVSCLKCKGKASVKRTNATRERRTKERVEWAAKFWVEWAPGKRQLERSKWIARKMNNMLFCGDEGITGKWVTQHRQEIEAEVERRNHAKS